MRQQVAAVAARRDVGEVSVEHRVERGVLLVARGVEHAERDPLGMGMGEELRDLRAGRIAVERDAARPSASRNIRNGGRYSSSDGVAGTPGSGSESP